MPLKCETNLLQDLGEFNKFLELVKKLGVRSYLEIGSKHGGSWWRISNALPKGSRVVSVDLPHGDGSFKVTEPSLKACHEELKRRGYDAHLFLTDSTNRATIEAVHKLGPFDLVFIDANHTEPYVRQDWANYGPLGNVVAFHDIAWKFLAHKDDIKRLPIHVPEVWAEIKRGYEHIEIKHCVAANGIGVLWRNRPIASTS
jgi:predicted O-methyltransferase YrrM